jgi:RNA polymerase II subunit A-like phosphatase
MIYIIYCRPGTREFLKEMDKKYEMHIYTMGTRSYAIEISKILDPDQSLFKERILSRDESGSFSIKSIKRLFPCDQSMVVVVDDRSDVWGWSPNLIHVNPCKLFFCMYFLDNYFMGIGDINAPKPISVQENSAENSETKDTDQSSTTLVESNASSLVMRVDNDRELTRVKWMLNEIHDKFYDSYGIGGSPDVGEILPGMKCNVLKNVKIVFSGIIPLGVDPTKYCLEFINLREFIWKKATEFGAEISTTIDQTVTHVVAIKKGTLKINEAKRIPGVFIVKPTWLYSSINKWQKQDEYEHILEENKLLIRIESTSNLNKLEQVDAHDFEILSAQPTGPLCSHLEADDLLEMDREVDEAMNEDDSEFDSIEHEIDEGLDELFSAETEEFPVISRDSIKRKRTPDEEIIRD